MRNGSQELYELAEDAYKNTPKDQFEVWSKHPLTRALVYTLMGDQAAHLEEWLNGGLTGETADMTLQLNSKALGSVHATEAILTWIDDVKGGDLYD